MFYVQKYYHIVYDECGEYIILVNIFTVRLISNL